MPSAPADPAPSARPPRTGRPRVWAAGLVLSALAAVVLVLQSGDDTVITPPDRPRAGAEPGAGTATREDGAAELLAELESVLAHGSRADTTRLAADRGSRRELGRIFDNVRSLRLTDLGLRYVAQGPALSPGKRTGFGPEAWVGDVEVRWRLRGYEAAPSVMEVPFVFAEGPDGVTFGSAAGIETRGSVTGSVPAGATTTAPLWLLDRVHVDRSPRALVVATRRRDLTTYAGLAREAVAVVSTVLPRWSGGLVVQVPGSEAQLDRVLGAEPGAYASIAAVTSTVDGSLDERSPAHILVNPDVFGQLGPDGSQIVMSHEATHVATGAATSAMPLWLLEGFADYVALARSDLPVQLTASQVLAEVRKDGPPQSLPDEGDFDPSNKLLGSSYEAAWLACRLIAEQHGEQRLIQLYDRVDAGTPLPAALEAVLGTDLDTFTGEWQDYLVGLAG